MDFKELEELLQRALQQDDVALGQLVEYVREMIRKRASQKLPNSLQSRLDTSDIAQEVCLRIDTGFSDFKGQSSQEFVGWVNRILSNTLATQYNHHHTGSRSVGREESADQLGHAARKNDNPVKEVLRKERLAKLQAAIQDLPELHRLIFEGRFLQGHSFSELSEMYDITNQYARVLFYRAVQQLKDQLGDPE